MLALLLGAQQPATQSPAATSKEKGMAPRASANDYQAHARVGAISIGAEFTRHAVNTPEGSFSNEDYVAVEVGFFGGPGERTKISVEDFSLKINGKKAIVSQPYGVVLANLKDPEWVPPEAPKAKGSGLSTGDGGGAGDPPPPPPKMPMPLVRAMQQKVQKAAMPEGDRPLPEAGLLFFSYHGQSEKIKSVELLYSGAAGKAVLTLQP